MKPSVLVFALLLAPVGACAAEEPSEPAVQIEELVSPAVGSTAGVSLTRGRDGSVWLSWAESNRKARDLALRFSTFRPAEKKWNSPRTIVEHPALFHLFEFPEAFPPLSSGADGHATAVFFFGYAAHNVETEAWLRQTADGGETWGRGEPVSHEDHWDIEAAALTTLTDGRVLVAWVDGRDRSNREKHLVQLFARVIGESGPDILIDSSVPRFSEPSLTTLPNGDALLAYNRSTEDRRLTLRTARFTKHGWGDSTLLSRDTGHTRPALASSGDRVVVAWSSPADNVPRAVVSVSSDAGAHFSGPLRIDDGHLYGPIDAIILSDGAILATWTKSDGSTWLCRVTPSFVSTKPVQLTPALVGATTKSRFPLRTIPRIAVVHDGSDEDNPVQVVIAFAGAGPAPMRSFFVTFPREKNARR